MAGTIEEIAALIKSLKLDNELNNEDLWKTLNDIRNKVAELHSYDEAADIATAIQQTIDSKALVDMQKIKELDETLRQLRIKIESSADIAELTEQVKTLADNFKAGFNSVVSFANKDADAKNLLLDRMEDLEKAVKNGEMIETLRQRTDELVKNYENFISDSNLRHGNMVSTIVDLKNKLDEYSSKNNYVFGTIDHTISDTSNKITNLESTVSSSLGNVNSKLYSLGDDIQKILNDGFDHLKYLSSNMSEAMNSNSLDVKTTLEVLKANISDFTEHLKVEFGSLNTGFSEQIETGYEKSLTISNDILNNVKNLENIFAVKINNSENLLAEKINNVVEFINALQDAVSVMLTENNTHLNDKLSELSDRLQEFNIGYEKILVSTNEEIKNVSEAVSRTTDDIAVKLQETGNKEIYVLKEELLASASSNLHAIVERIQGISDSVDSYRNNTAENLSTYLTTIRDLFEDFSSKVENSQNNTEVLEKLSNLEIIMSRFDIEKNENFSHLQSMIQKNTDAIEALNIRTGTTFGLEKIENLINEHSASKDEKLEALKNLVNEYKNSVEKLSGDIHTQSEKELYELSELKTLANDILPKQSALNDLSTLIENRVFECKNSLTEEIIAVKTSITAINEGLNSLTPGSDETQISMKLTELNNQLTESTQNYEQALAMLNTRLEEYVEASEKISTITKTKLDESSNEFAAIQSRFEALSGQLNTLVGDSGLVEILANIRQQFNVVVEQIKNEKDGIVEGVQTSLSENLNNICTNLSQIRSNLENNQYKQFENFENLIFNLEAVKFDINSVRSVVEETVSQKLETLTSEFKPFENAIKDFVSLNFTETVNEIKQQIELSYVNLRTELGDTIGNNTLFTNIEKAYQNSAAKLTSLEELVKNTIEENINSINNTLFNVQHLTESNLSIIEDVQTTFHEELIRIEMKIQENKNVITSSITQELSELKDIINNNRNVDAEQLRNIILPMLENDDLINVIIELNKTLADKIT